MGLVIATGLTICTLFTLFVVPAVYMLLAADHHEKNQQNGKDTKGGPTGGSGTPNGNPPPHFPVPAKWPEDPSILTTL